MMAVIPSTDGQVRHACKMIFTSTYFDCLSYSTYATIIAFIKTAPQMNHLSMLLLWVYTVELFGWYIPTWWSSMLYWSAIYHYCGQLSPWLHFYSSCCFSLSTNVHGHKHFYFWRDKSGTSYVVQVLKLITTLHGEVMSMLSLNSFHIKYIVWGWVFTIWQTER